MVTLSANGVSVVYGAGHTARQALSDVSLSFSNATVTLLKGPSGSGKTTLLSILGGLLKPHGGRVTLAGMDVYAGDGRETAARRRRLFGFVFQMPQLFPMLTVFENVKVPLTLDGIGRREADAGVRRALASVGMADRAHDRPRLLSGGEQQRVAVARALVSEPSVILADEPTAALDAANGRDVTALLRMAAHDFGRTVVIVSHDDRLMMHADRIVHLVDGRVASDEGRSAC